MSVPLDRIKLYNSPAGRYLLLGRLLFGFRQLRKKVHYPIRLTMPILSGALMVVPIGVNTNALDLAKVPKPPAVEQPSPPPGTITIQIHDGTGHPAPNLQGIPEVTPHPPGSTHNTYAKGNCTWYVASKRAIPSRWGNARYWLSRARAAGYATGSIPVPGAIAQTTAGWAGHVAYVETVQGDSVLISEMNYRGLYRTDQRWVKSSEFNYIY